MSARRLLLEIGCENIPASYIEPAFLQLAADAESVLRANRLEYGSIYATGTPRRLVLIVEDLRDRQAAAEETVTGPPASKAFDEGGKPTPAAEGFARSLGVSVAKLGMIATPRGEYLGMSRKLSRRKTTALLREQIPSLVAGLRFPKAMKWEESGTRFARPVRWIVALYGSDPLRVRMADVASGVRTHRRPWMAGENQTVRSAAGYEAVMARLGVIVDHQRRRECIRALATRESEKLGLILVENEDLLTELSYMTEDPRALVGSFDEKYLALPPEVVTTAMRSHQRYMALTDKRGKLSARFIAFTDSRVTGPAEVRRGNEKVLRARLEDAMFYWNEDVKRGMEGLADELDRIVFIEGLGSIGDKARRIGKLSLFLNGLIGGKKYERAAVERAARLVKADIASEMVKDGKEFTKLQGLIGSCYARAAKETPEVVSAIRDHYQPRTPSDPVPRFGVGTLVGVADRIDTIVGCFLVGLIPSGSQDPYALRRSANGMIRLLVDEHRADLEVLIEQSLQSYEGRGDHDKAGPAIVEFMKGRCEAFLKEQKVPYDVADAVILLSWSKPGLALHRARAIAKMRGNEEFERLVTGLKRVGNIISPAARRFGVDWGVIHNALGGGAVDGVSDFAPEKLVEKSEWDLHAAVADAIPVIQRSEQTGDFAAVLSGLSRLADPIDRYFDKILVNCEDEALRANRHAFLAIIYAIFARYADFSCIVERDPPD